MTQFEYDVVVVGAGFAGAVAARDLADQGKSVVLLESADRVGGRTFSRPFAGRTEIIELGGGWINPDLNPLLHAEVLRYGIELKEDDEDHGSTHFLTQGRVTSTPVPGEELAALEGLWARGHEAARRFSVGFPVFQQPLKDLDVSAGEFLGPLNLPDATRAFVYSYLAAFTGAHPDETSVLWPLSKVAAFGYSIMGLFNGQAPGTGCSLMFANGTGDLVGAIAGHEGVDLRLGDAVRAIHQDIGRVTVTTESGAAFTASAVVVAVPVNVLRKLDFVPALPPAQGDVVRKGHSGRASKVYMIVRNVPDAPVAIGDSEFQLIVPAYRVEDGGWMLTGFGAQTYKPFDANDISAVESAVRAYFPEAEVLAIDTHDWNADSSFDGTYLVDAPGDAYDVTRTMNQPHGRVIFAGADIDDSIWRISMEGAVHSGHEAAARATAILRENSARV